MTIENSENAFVIDKRYDTNSEKEELIDFIKLNPDLNLIVKNILSLCTEHTVDLYVSLCGTYPNQFLFFDIDTDFNVAAKDALSNYDGIDKRIELDLNF